MRIMLSNTLYPPIVKGGAERSVSFLAHVLASRGHDVAVLTMSPDIDEPEQEDEGGISLFRLPLKAPYWPYSESNEVSSIKKLFLHVVDDRNPLMSTPIQSALRSFKPDVIHTNIMALFTPTLWMEARKENVPILHNLRDYWVMCVRSGFFPGDKECNRNCIECRALTTQRRRLTSLVDGVVAVSQYTLDTHINAGLFPNTRLRKAILSARGESIEKKAERDANDVLTLGFLGRIKPSKGVHILIEALSRVPAHIPIKLVVAGDGSEDYLESLRQMSPEGRVEFWGWRKPEEVYSAIDIVAIPSLYPEPLPRTAIEAYNARLPVLAARTGGTPEVVEEGRNGWTYDAYDVTELARLISTLGETRQDREIDASVFDPYIRRSDPEFVAHEYEECYSFLMESHRS